MNSSHTLTVLWTNWSATASVAAVLLTAGLCWTAWRRSGYARSHGLLELLRLTIVVIVAALFNQPEWVEEYEPKEKPTVAVLWDDSVSMRTRDVVPADAASSITRRQAIEHLIDPAAWRPLSERFDVAIEPFSGEQAGSLSNLYTPLIEAPRKFERLSGIVLISDGDWNDGLPPVRAATTLRLMGVPVFVVPVGSETRLPDVKLLSLNAPTFGVAGKSVRIPFTIESSLPREFLSVVTLKTSDGATLTKEVRVSAMSRTTEAIDWEPPAVGDYTLTVSVPVHPDEKLPDNNELSAPIQIREEQLRVLVVESYPRWEYRYLRNALLRDPGVEVSCLLFHPGLENVGGGGKDYIKEFPSGRDELSRYDVVFVGDVGVDDNQLTVEQCRLLKGLVEHQASGLVFMPGWQGRQHSLERTELADLMPVSLDPSQPEGWGSRTPGRFELTQLGRRSLLTRLADSQDDNLRVWEVLPGFQWYAPVLRAKAGTEVLAVHQDVSNQHGRLPLLVTRPYGAGKILFMGTDGAWRWRKGVEDKYHYRFWGQVVRWMAYQRNMAKGETMRLYYRPDQPRIRQTLTLHANVMEANGEPLAKGDVSARITAPSGKVHTVGFQSSGFEWGVFHTDFPTKEAGEHQVVLTCKETGASLETSFFVQGEDEEQIGDPARPEVLEEIARVTKGAAIEPEKLDQIVQSLANIGQPPAAVRRVQLWSHPAVAAGLVALLSVFWVCRKVVGLI